ncbi:unnamed protein product [Cuscuta campestris]|uniref:Uncharacterized protein n=1 Tax=Cuscuta campestris TaxID=132261 RepID=A0A484LTX2_9ASTE|nr:unnamed protein product [Cuscuta campestris]
MSAFDVPEVMAVTRNNICKNHCRVGLLQYIMRLCVKEKSETFMKLIKDNDEQLAIRAQLQQSPTYTMANLASVECPWT